MSFSHRLCPKSSLVLHLIHNEVAELDGRRSREMGVHLCEARFVVCGKPEEPIRFRIPPIQRQTRMAKQTMQAWMQLQGKLMKFRLNSVSNQHIFTNSPSYLVLAGGTCLISNWYSGKGYATAKVPRSRKPLILQHQARK